MKAFIFYYIDCLVQKHKLFAEQEGVSLREWYDFHRDSFRKYGIDVDKIDVNMTLEEELELVHAAHKGTPLPWVIKNGDS